MEKDSSQQELQSMIKKANRIHNKRMRSLQGAREPGLVLEVLQLLLENGSHGGGIHLSLRLLEDLAHKPGQHALVAGVVAVHKLSVLSQLRLEQGVAEGLDLGVVSGHTDVHLLQETLRRLLGLPDLLQQGLGHRGRDLVVLEVADDGANVRCRHGILLEGEVLVAEVAQEVVADPAPGEGRSLDALADLLEVGHSPNLLDEDAGLVLAQLVLGLEAVVHVQRQLREGLLDGLHTLGGDDQGTKVEVLEDAVVVLLLLVTESEGLVLLGVVEAGLALEGEASEKGVGLSLDLVVDGGLDDVGGVDVLQLHDGRLQGAVLRDDVHVDIGTEGAVLSLRLADAEGLEEDLEGGEEGAGLVGAVDAGGGDDLQQGGAGAVQVDEAHAVVVDGLAGVLLKLDPVDLDVEGAEGVLALGAVGGGQDRQLAVSDDRMPVLCDLVAGGVVVVEVVLPLEDADGADAAVEGEAGLDGLVHAVLVENGKGSGQREVESGEERVGGAIQVSDGGSGEELCV